MDATLQSTSAIPTRRQRGRGQAVTTPGISLVLPAYNEEAVISQAIDEADGALGQITSDYELLVVDDGSSDDTLKIARFEASHRPHVRVLSHDQNRGYGAALRTGFGAATKELVGFTDADCQFDLSQLNRLVVLLSSCDVACGYRIDRQDRYLRILYSRMYNMLVRLLLGIPVRDCDCALKLFRRDVLESISNGTDGFLVNAELLTEARLQGKQIVEVGVNHRPRAGGESTVSFRHVIPVLIALLRFWWSHVQFPRRATTASDASHPAAASRTLAITAGLTLLCALIFFARLSYPLFEPDENRYVQIAMEMVQSGDYLVPRLLGEPYLDKPPLLYWAIAASFRLFGISEFSARLVPALGATLTVLITFLFGQRLFGYRKALTGSILLLLCIGFVLTGRYILMDGLLTCFTTTSLLAGLIAIRGEELRWRWFLGAAIACGCGIMTKGPVALVLTAPPLIALPWLNQRLARVSLRHIVVFTSVAFAITIPWFAAMVWRQPDFAVYFLWKHHVLRFLAAFDHQAPFWFYIPALLIGMFPVSLLLAPVVAFLLSRSTGARQMRSDELGFLVFAAGWIVLFFSASSCKLPTYVLPAIPLLCLIAAHVVCAARSGSVELPLARLTQYLPLSATITVIVVGVGLAIANLVTQAHFSVGSVVDGLVIVLPASLLGWQAAVRGKQIFTTMPWGIAAATSILVMMFAFQCFVPQLADNRSIHANAARLQIDAAGHHRPVAYLDWQIDAQSLYFPVRPAVHFTEHDLDELAQLATSQREVVLVAGPDSAALLRKRVGHSVAFQRMAGARGRLYLLTSHESR